MLDREQLRDITMDDEKLMREVLSALWDDTSAHVAKLEAAVRSHDRDQCVRLAHYSKGACANIGASATAAVLRRIEVDARQARFEGCERSLGALATALEQLRAEILAF